MKSHAYGRNWLVALPAALLVLLAGLTATPAWAGPPSFACEGTAEEWTCNGANLGTENGMAAGYEETDCGGEQTFACPIINHTITNCTPPTGQSPPLSFSINENSTCLNDTNSPHDWTVCGNGYIEEPETCDDSNTDPDDGCSASCQVEDGWQCEGEPSVCEPLPGPPAEHPAITALACICVMALIFGGWYIAFIV